MNAEQFGGLVRHILGAAGAYVLAKGFADESTVAQASGALATLAAIAWSYIEKLRR